ncbi:hypothetical protein [Microbacterium sp. 2FI]|uniref:hypothetical protein n=1 Tax=Microbacterium sp. 2FI TaxID=2502193 RepID=UPI0010F64FC6|nr:hypothetical protein [Microbacterium sp. 2FI]
MEAVPHRLEEPQAVAVPGLKAYFSTTADLETAEQVAFYLEFRGQVLAGTAPDLQGNLSYGFVLLHELVASRRLEPRAFEDALRLFIEQYPSTSLASHAHTWLADLRFLDGDFQAGFDDLARHGMSLDLYITLAQRLVDTRLTTATVDGWLGDQNGLSALGRRRRGEVRAHLQDLLDASHDELGQSLVTDLWRRLRAERQVGDPTPPLEDEFGGFMTDDEIWYYVTEGEYALERTPVDAKERRAFEGMRHLSESIEWPASWQSTDWFHPIAHARLRFAYRQAENLLRTRSGLPLVGEGWVSEVGLLNEIRAAFPNERIEHQARPEWLKPQSLDIYFTERSVALEYQGIQHSQPVERFGGVVAFERQLERDARKRAACDANDCTLVEVHPGYDRAEVIELVRRAIAR